MDDDDMTRYHDFNGCDILTNDIDDACYLCDCFELCLQSDLANLANNKS